MNKINLFPVFMALVAAPFLFGIINRTKAVFAGRKGQPLAQTYFDVFKLLRKGAVYSRTTTWIFRAGPIVCLAALLTALLIVPMGSINAPLSFEGDLVLFAYFLCLARFFTVLAALDTGSSFEGMGASREVFFALLAEPVFLVGLAVVAQGSNSISLTKIFGHLSPEQWAGQFPSLALIVTTFIIILLTENSRIPVDDPNTHLELTMIHEVMVLDHSGPDLAFITYGSAIKLWIFSAIIVNIAVPVHTGSVLIDVAAFLGGMIALAVLIGVVESTMARLRLLNVPKLLVGALALAILSLIVSLR